jgi:flavodoxin
MKALVAYDTLFGNTERIARAIAAGLGTADEVELTRLEAARFDDADWELVVVGAPTQHHEVSRPTDRWLKDLPCLCGVPVAAFDTRYRMPRTLSGAASLVIVNQMRLGGAILLAEPQSFFVRGREGPLEPGEEERATEWGANLRRLYEGRQA